MLSDPSSTVEGRFSGSCRHKCLFLLGRSFRSLKSVVQKVA
jgi:hypothetical protein